MDYLKLVPQLTSILPSTIENTDCFWLKVVIDLLFTKEEKLSVIVMLLNIIQNTLLLVNEPGRLINNEKIAYNIFVKELLLQAYNSRSGNTPKIRTIFDLLLVIFGVELKTVIHNDGTAFMINPSGEEEEITNFYTDTETCQSFKTSLIRKFFEHRDKVEQINASITQFITLLQDDGLYNIAKNELKTVITNHCGDIEGKLIGNQLAILWDVAKETKIISNFKSILSPWKTDIAMMIATFIGKSSVSGVKSGVSRLTTGVSNFATNVMSRFTSAGTRRKSRKYQTRRRYKGRMS